ncbi:MAG TPA: response regulator [Candidatus Polarisedimenticolia bacterium]|jgi:DNA-binding NtrC family response regulator|nr:response regulator [Candidatus Polarisedimenticolia bacterium]
MTARRILIVDDDTGSRECYARLLRKNGYEPCLAASGTWVERNLEHLKDVRVILLDYRMPGMTGLELLGRLRRAGFRASALLVSAQVSPEMFADAERLGISEIFHKPVRSAALLESVADALAQFQEEDSRENSGNLLI